uniref:Tex_N domain-containing protein n=2 Tax=Mesocestoides corti TaxID=53468 RepID=A0A5K3FV86_MESCO
MEPMDVDWDVVTEVAASTGTDNRTASRVINLLNDGNTLPFIARYRKEATGNMEPEALRLIKAKLTSYREVIDKVENAFKHLTSRGVMTEDLKKSLRQCKTVTDVALIVSPGVNLYSFLYADGTLQGDRAQNSGGESSGSRSGTSRVRGFPFRQTSQLQHGRRGLVRCLEIPPKLCTTRIPPPQIPPKNKPLASGGRSNYEKDVLTFQAYFDFSMPFNRIAPHRVSWCQ